MPLNKPTVTEIARVYGLAEITVRKWMHRGITAQDFLNPFSLAQKLRASAVNDSPRLRLLEDKATCGAITFRLAVAGLIEPKE